MQKVSLLAAIWVSAKDPLRTFSDRKLCSEEWIEAPVVDTDTLFIVIVVLGAAVAGASPALLPSRVWLAVRLSLALLLLAVSLWYNRFMADAPHPYHLVILVPFWFGLALGVIGMLFRRKVQRPAQ